MTTVSLNTLKGLLNPIAAELMFDEDSEIEIVNENTGAHYRKNDKGEITLGGDVVEASESWIMGLPVTRVFVHANHMIVLVDG